MNRADLVEGMRQEICRHQCEGETLDECKANPNCLCFKDASAALRAIEAMGCAVVPREPTDQMIMNTAASSMHRSGIHSREKRDIYIWMLKASPFLETKPVYPQPEEEIST